jgi:hypothetical protein
MTLRVICPVTVLLLVLASPPFLGSIVSADTGHDGYVSGYAAAVLEREFHLSAPSLRVQDGVITLHATDLKGVDRAKVLDALSRIRGAARVAIVETAPAFTTQALAPSPPASTAAAPRLSETKEPQTGLLPGGGLFKPLIADPRWPHFAVAYQSYLNDTKLKDVTAVSFGESFSLYRDTLPRGVWEVGIQAGVFALFDLNEGSKDLINADYFVAALGGYRYESLSLLGRLFHQSSHLGDEILLQNRVQRVNLSYEGVDLKFSYELFGDVLRAYAGGGYLFARDPAELKPASLQWGAEFRSPWPGAAVPFRPIAAVDVQNREENDWHSDISLRAGVEFKSVLMTRNLQVLLEYFRGHSPNGQFYQQKIDYIGLGAHFHF